MSFARWAYLLVSAVVLLAMVTRLGWIDWRTIGIVTGLVTFMGFAFLVTAALPALLMFGVAVVMSSLVERVLDAPGRPG